MSWDILWSKIAETQIGKIVKSDRKIAQQIVTKLDEIEDDPYTFTEKLSGFNLRNKRVGNYRIILNLEN